MLDLRLNLSKLCSTLRCFDGLQNVYFNIKNFLNIKSLSSLSLIYILDALKSNKMLKNLDLQIPRNDGESVIICEFAAKSLFELISSSAYSKLEYLNLDLSIYEKYNSEHLIMLSQGLKDHEMINELSLKFSIDSQFSEESLIQFSNVLSDLIKIKKLSIELPEIVQNSNLPAQFLQKVSARKSYVSLNFNNLFSYFRRNQTKVYFKTFSNIPKSFLSVVNNKQLIIDAFNAHQIELNFLESNSISCQNVANLVRSILSAENNHDLSVPII